MHIYARRSKIQKKTHGAIGTADGSEVTGWRFELHMKQFFEHIGIF